MGLYYKEVGRVRIESYGVVCIVEGIFLVVLEIEFIIVLV